MYALCQTTLGRFSLHTADHSFSLKGPYRIFMVRISIVSKSCEARQWPHPLQLALDYDVAERRPEALQTYPLAIESTDKVAGANSLDAANLHLTFAGCLEESGQLTAAEGEIRKGIGILEKQSQLPLPELVDANVRLARLQRAGGISSSVLAQCAIGPKERRSGCA